MHCNPSDPSMYRLRAVVLFTSDHARAVTVKIMQIGIVNEEGLHPRFSWLAASPLARSIARATEHYRRRERPHEV